MREIFIVTAVPTESLRNKPVGIDSMVKKFSKNSKTDLSWMLHWALQIGDQFFELQRGYPDPLRTGLHMSKWDQEKKAGYINDIAMESLP